MLASLSDWFPKAHGEPVLAHADTHGGVKLIPKWRSIPRMHINQSGIIIQRNSSSGEATVFTCTFYTCALVIRAPIGDPHTQRLTLKHHFLAEVWRANTDAGRTIEMIEITFLKSYLRTFFWVVFVRE